MTQKMPIHSYRSSPGQLNGEDGVAAAKAASQKPQALPEPSATEIQNAVNRLYLLPEAPAPRVLLFTALETNGDNGRVCTQVSELLAASVPGAVCLVDADLRHPFLHGILRIPRAKGLADLLENPTQDLQSLAIKKPGSKLWVLTAGTPSAKDPASTCSKAMGERIKELREEFDYVVVAAPAAGAYPDALGLARLADGVVLILRARSTPRDVALRVRDEFGAAGIPIAGAILLEGTPKK